VGWLGVGAAKSPVKRGFSAQNGNPEIKRKLPAGAFFRLD